MQYPEHFDVIVIGGGHAGTEAAYVASNMGMKTLLLTHNIDTLGQMSCNPAIGGIGKGHLVKEIDALGGLMAQAIDKAGIHFKILNQSKGAAVRATRAQADRVLYKQVIRKTLEQQKNLQIFQQAVDDLIIENDHVYGVVTQMGVRFEGHTVILTTGTFLGGKIHIGNNQFEGGRAGDPPANQLALRLRELPFNVERLKTGTPPRIDGNSIDFSQLDKQPGDHPIPVFSFLGLADEHPKQVCCHITRTTEETHDIIRNNLQLSAMYSGNIEGIGPRYCPSIEDKIVRFSDKNSHQIFIEPEGLSTTEIYPNGISTSLPFNVQYQFVRSIVGFEQAHITRPGYAIEYDFFDPQDLNFSLETKFLSGLYFAGQINGTTGYEEAAAQGLLAGINAALKIKGEPPWYPKRNEAYIGVMIDDLITRGTNEPYRMFTSRAEYRLLLREDNADLRLTPIGYQLGTISEHRWQQFEQKKNLIEQEKSKLNTMRLNPRYIDDDRLKSVFKTTLTKDYALYELLRRPEVSYRALTSLIDDYQPVCHQDVIEQIEIQSQYEGYISRQNEEIARFKKHESMLIPDDFTYNNISGLSNEVTEKLSKVKPQTIGQASRISGVTPAAIALLLIYIKKLKKS